MTGPERDAPETTQPGEREGRRLAQPPSARYVEEPGAAPDGAGRTDRAGRAGSSLSGPLARALAVAGGGSVLLVFVGAVMASTFGLLFVAGLTGAGVGLVLSRAVLPRDQDRAGTPRRTVAWLSIGLSLAAVALAALGTWLVARQEGGTLGLIDYLLTTFGPFVPAEALAAAIGAWWGATAGPVQS